MLISLAVVPVAPEVWISNITDDDIRAFGNPQTTGFGSHVLRLTRAKLADGLLTFERRDALFVRRGRTDEAVLFRELSGSDSIIKNISVAVTPDDDVYWVTVGTGRQENFQIGMQKGVWGVQDQYARRLEDIKPRDKIIFYGRDIGFALCEVRGRPHYDNETVWPDDLYPYRIAITPPLKRNEAKDFSSIYRNLVDARGVPYASPQAAGRAIGGGSGVFRKLLPREISGILRGLGW